MNSPRKTVLRCVRGVVLLWAAGSAAPACIVEYTIDVPPPALKAPAEYTPPPQPELRIDPPLPLFFTCNCGAISWHGYPVRRDVTTELEMGNPVRFADPIAPLLTAFRQASWIELWRLAPVLSPHRFTGHLEKTWGYRGAAIIGLTRDREVGNSGALLTAIARALASSRPQDDVYFDDATPLAELMVCLHFTPDFVVTLAGPESVRIEFNLSTAHALLQARGKWDILQLEPADVAALTAFRDCVTFPTSPRLVPQLAVDAGQLIRSSRRGS